MATEPIRRRRVLLGGGAFGFGFGALLDVLVLHQILQAHHLLSGVHDPRTYRGLRTNLYYDGVFALAMLAVAFAGAAVVWRATNRSSEPHSTVGLLGSILVGMGAFNTIDGVVSHYVLEIHDIVDHAPFWNPPWLIASVVLLGAGVALLGADRRGRN